MMMSLVAPVGAAEELADEVLAKIRAAAPDAPLEPPAKPRRLLIFCLCRGFYHPVIPLGSAALKIVGEKSGAYQALISDDPEIFTPERLAEFDAVCMFNTTGELFLPADFKDLSATEQEAARQRDAELKRSFREFVASGHGLVGIHAATDCFYEWPEYGVMIGAYFDGHPWNEPVTVKTDDPQHSINAVFKGEPFEIADEIYQFREPYCRDLLHVLLSLDTSRTNMNKPGVRRQDRDFAVSWIHRFGRGRVFYCSLGHRDEIFFDPRILRHYLAGIQYAMGDLSAGQPPAQPDPPGWIELFNGKDLTGWTCKPGSWKVEDGTLARVGGGDIWTERQFGDFVLELEFKVAPQANSGVFFRTADIRDPVQTGIELQVLDSFGKQEVGRHDCGAIYDCLAPSRNAVKPPGEWNHVVLICRGGCIRALMNGIQIIDMNLDDWTEPGKNPDGTPNKFKRAYRDMPRVGHIGLQDHGSPVWYRHIRIRPLNPL